MEMTHTLKEMKPPLPKAFSGAFQGCVMKFQLQVLPYAGGLKKKTFRWPVEQHGSKHSTSLAIIRRLASLCVLVHWRFFLDVPRWLAGLFLISMRLDFFLRLNSLTWWLLGCLTYIRDHLLPKMIKDTALAPADMSSIKASAAIWLRKHVGVDARKLARSRRIWDSEARAAYTITTASSKIHESAQPCIACGTWTVSWCESCDMTSPPKATCTECDADGITCTDCREAGKTYEKSKEQHVSSADGQMMEISGFQTDDGFVRLPHPMYFDTADIDVDTDGNIDMPKLMERIRKMMQ